MKARDLTLCAAALALSAAAHAGGIRSVDVPRITNGGTGFTPVAGTAGPTWQPVARDHRLLARTILPAGEASTMVDGRPNVHPDLPPVVQRQGRWPSAREGQPLQAWSVHRAVFIGSGWGTPD